VLTVCPRSAISCRSIRLIEQQQRSGCRPFIAVGCAPADLHQAVVRLDDRYSHERRLWEVRQRSDLPKVRPHGAKRTQLGETGPDVEDFIFVYT